MEVDLSVERIPGRWYDFSWTLKGKRDEAMSTLFWGKLTIFRRFYRRAGGEQKHILLLPQPAPLLAPLSDPQRERGILLSLLYRSSSEEQTVHSEFMS